MQPLVLPFNATSNKAAVIVTWIMAVSPFLTAALLYFALNLGANNLSPQLRNMLPLVYFILILPINLFAITRLKPRDLVINATSIDMTPIAVLGYKSTAPESRSVSEFKSVDYVKVSGGGRSGPVYRICLRSIRDKQDLVVDAPKDTDKHQFVAQFGAALNLQVNDYVRN